MTDPAILIVDRLPIPDIYADMGLEVPDADFLQIDARTIGEELTGHSFDLIVQDFVLNCMPPAHWPALLQSTRALLKPEGLGLISLSTDAQPTVEPAQPIGKAFSLWPEKCADSSWSVSDLANSDEEYAQMSAHLAGKTLFNELTGHILQVTSPACSFEFFAPEYEINQMFRQAGLKVTPVHVSKAVDYSGLACTRHRLIVTLA